jgi:hypothetical protein
MNGTMSNFVLAARFMGPGWITPRHFLVGASILSDSLLAALKRAS